MASLPADCFVRVERVRANNYNSFVPALGTVKIYAQKSLQTPAE